jgi:hypothetical protein
MAIEAGYASGIHQALDEVIALHAVFVCGAIGEVGESCLAQFMLFELPEFV